MLATYSSVPSQRIEKTPPAHRNEDVRLEVDPEVVSPPNLHRLRFTVHELRLEPEVRSDVVFQRLFKSKAALVAPDAADRLDLPSVINLNARSTGGLHAAVSGGLGVRNGFRDTPRQGCTSRASPAGPTRRRTPRRALRGARSFCASPALCCSRHRGAVTIHRSCRRPSASRLISYCKSRPNPILGEGLLF